MLDDDQLVDTNDAATLNEIADQANPSGSSPTLSGVSAEPGTDDENNIPDSLEKYRNESSGSGIA
jgi:hypothetical protein